MPIASVDIETEVPELPGDLHRLAGLHPASRTSVIRRQLLFSPGDSVDTVRVAETLRRLRQRRLFSDVVVLARRCDPTGPTSLVVRTRDSWTLRPSLRLRSPTQLSVGVEDRNLLGSGGSIALTSEMSTRGPGAALAFGDPFLLGSSMDGSFRIANLAGAHTLRVGVRNHEYSVFDPWRFEANVARLSFRDTTASERSLHSVAAAVAVGRRVGSDPLSVTVASVGVEFDSAASISPSQRAVGPDLSHVRSYLGVDLGVLRRAAAFDTAAWIVPGRGFLDVPVGWEGDGIISAGYERDARAPAMKLDLWSGRVWLPQHGKIFMADAWFSEYFGNGVDQNEISRAAAAWYAEAPRGLWGARLTVEHMSEMDPDRRGLSLLPSADFTAAAVRPFIVRAGTTVAASVEEAVHLRPVGASSSLDLGAFVAGSHRWQVDDPTVRTLHAEVVGARLRLLSANGAISSIRVDLGYPIGASAALTRKGFVTVTYGALFDVSRQRDGRRAF